MGMDKDKNKNKNNNNNNNNGFSCGLFVWLKKKSPRTMMSKGNIFHV